LSKAGDDVKKRQATRILEVRRRGNLLLCTLLLGNVAVNALLSILMADLTNGRAALCAGGSCGCLRAAVVHRTCWLPAVNYHHRPSWRNLAPSVLLSSRAG
jgi:hypothetical protein